MRDALISAAVPLTIWVSRRRDRGLLRRRRVAAVAVAAVLALGWLAARADETAPPQPVSADRPQGRGDAEHELLAHLQWRRQAFGDHSVEVAGSLALLGMLFYDRGDYRQSAAMLRQSLAIWSALPQPEPAALAFLQAQLAGARCRQQHGDQSPACEIAT